MFKCLKCYSIPKEEEPKNITHDNGVLKRAESYKSAIALNSDNSPRNIERMNSFREQEAEKAKLDRKRTPVEGLKFCEDESTSTTSEPPVEGVECDTFA